CAGGTPAPQVAAKPRYVTMRTHSRRRATPMPHAIDALEHQLDHPDRAARLHALHELKHMATSGRATVEPEHHAVNMHCHTIYSYNAHGYSPCRAAWEMYRRGLAAAGTVDFDVLDALE